MVSQETKRILGIASMALILILLLARGFPVPFMISRPAVITRNPGGPHGFSPALIFDANISITNGKPVFNLTLTQSHSYLWKFDVTKGSVEINLTNPKTGSVFWTVGPRSLGQWHLNGTGVVSFNWTAPASTYYSLILDNQPTSLWLSSGIVYLSPYSWCDIHVWDLSSNTPRVFVW